MQMQSVKEGTVVKVMVLLILASAMLFAVLPAEANNSLRDQVNQHQGGGAGDAITGEVDRMGAGAVTFVQGIFVVVAVLFVIWAAIVYGGSGGDPQKIGQAKQLAVGFLVMMICVFKAPQIVGGLMSMFGIGDGASIPIE